MEKRLRLDRWPVIFRKIVFGSRSEAGAHAFSVNRSNVLTAQRQHLEPLPILQSLLLNGHAHSASHIFQIRRDPGTAPHAAIG